MPLHDTHLSYRYAPTLWGTCKAMAWAAATVWRDHRDAAREQRRRDRLNRQYRVVGHDRWTRVEWVIVAVDLAALAFVLCLVFTEPKL